MIGVSVVFVAAGIALSDRIPWYYTAFFALCALAGLLMMRGGGTNQPSAAFRLTVDTEGITLVAGDRREHVAWTDIARVRIVTTDEGPFVTDVFFAIDAKSGGGCVVPHDLAVQSELLDTLQARLPGLDNEAVIAAMGSTERREFTIWRASGHA